MLRMTIASFLRQCGAIIDMAVKTDESIKSLTAIKGIKGLGVTANIAEIGISGYEIQSKGYSHERAVDFGLGVFHYLILQDG